MVGVVIKRGKRIGLTGDVAITTDVRSTVDSESVANLKPSSTFKSHSSVFSETSYPRPLREFKLLKREVEYNFDVMKFKMRYLEKIN